MTEPTTDLGLKLTKWLEKQGYPLEMLVAQSFKQRGAIVRQSDYYIDHEEDKPREIDVLAKWYTAYEMNGLVELEIFYCIECKSQQKNPWIIFSPGTSKALYNLRLPASKDGRHYLLNLLHVVNAVGLFEVAKRAGYGITQAFKTGPDIPYQAVMSAVKAAIACISDSDRIAQDVEADLSQPYYSPVVAIPIVVIDGQLFECYLGEENIPVVQEIEVGAIEWKYPIGRATFVENPFEGTPTAFVCTVTALGKLIAFIEEFNNALVENLPIAQELAERKLHKKSGRSAG